MKVIFVSMITVRTQTKDALRLYVVVTITSPCVMSLNRFVVSCIPTWFWGPMVTLEDCLAAFFAADELKGKRYYTVLFDYNTPVLKQSRVDEKISVRSYIYIHSFPRGQHVQL